MNFIGYIKYNLSTISSLLLYVTLGVCYRGRVEINEKDIDGTCSSTCPDAKSYAVPLNHKCSRIENCRTKESGWKPLVYTLQLLRLWLLHSLWYVFIESFKLWLVKT